MPGIVKLLGWRALTEDACTNAEERCTFFDGNGVIAGHAHRKLGESLQAEVTGKFIAERSQKAEFLPHAVGANAEAGERH